MVLESEEIREHLKSQSPKCRLELVEDDIYELIIEETKNENEILTVLIDTDESKILEYEIEDRDEFLADEDEDDKYKNFDYEALYRGHGYDFSKSLEPSKAPFFYPETESIDYGNKPELGRKTDMLDEFIGYYTRTEDVDLALDPQKKRTHPISGNFADVVVNIPDLGALQFSRGTSYMPKWITKYGSYNFEDIVERESDSTFSRPDRLNRYSYANIIKQDKDEVIVHVRYVPDFKDPTQSGVAHENYTIKSTGQIIRKIIKPYKILENRTETIETLDLNHKGVSRLTLKTNKIQSKQLSHNISKIIKNPVGSPVLSLSFNENKGRQTKDEVASKKYTINGKSTMWFTGVSGSSLGFDGYKSDVTVPKENVKKIKNSFTISSWVSLSAYPFGTAQLAGQVSPNGAKAYAPDPMSYASGVYRFIGGKPFLDPITVDGKGYAIAVDSLGRANLMANIENQWIVIKSPKNIPLHSWNHISGSYDADRGVMSLYLNGKLVASKNMKGNLIQDTDVDFVIGKNKSPIWMDSGSEVTYEAFERNIFGIEGLIDEVNLYNRPLSSIEVKKLFKAGDKNATVLSKRELPNPKQSGFKLEHNTLKYHKLWDNLFADSGYEDVAITFDNLPTKLIFWRGMSYGPAWVMENNTWHHDQSFEFGDDHGLVEHMGDKEARYTHIRVIEDTPARKVVHWRYAVPAVTYRLWALAGELSWVDEYYTIYPDGTCVRHVTDHFNGLGKEKSWGWQSSYVLNPPGKGPKDTINSVRAVVIDQDGNEFELDSKNGVDESDFMYDGSLIWINSKSNYRLFRGVPKGAKVSYDEEAYFEESIEEGETPDLIEGVTRPIEAGNHYPISQLPNDGRLAFFKDRASHTEGMADVRKFGGNDTMLYGFSKRPEEGLPLVNIWNHPPEIKDSTTKSNGYIKSQHAFEFEGKLTEHSFRFDGEYKTINPCIIIKGWEGNEKVSVSVDGKLVNVKSGIHYNNGVRTLVVFVPMNLANGKIVIK